MTANLRGYGTRMTEHSTKTAFAATLAAASAMLCSPHAHAQYNEQAMQVPPECIAAAPLPEPVPPAEPAEEAYVMPTTGFVFTLPSQDSDKDAEPGEPRALHHCAPPLPVPPVRPTAPSLFSMTALPVGGSTVPTGKWDAARLARLTVQAGPWNAMLAKASASPSRDPLLAVNNWVNWNLRYQDDSYGDQWSSAPATLARGYGDCEDFALAKMALLEKLGVPGHDMYLVVLRDRQDVEHAILAVKRGGRLMVLDNRTDKVLPAELVHDYRPIMSYSGPFSWIYGERAR